MRSLRGEAWLTMLALLAALTVGIFGLPSTPISTPSVSATSIPSHSRGSVKAKQTTPAYLPDGKPTISGTSSKSASASSEVTVVIDATTVDSDGSSPSSKRTAGNAVTAAPFVASTTPTVTSTATSTPASTAPPTFLPASASPATVAVVTSAVSSDPTSRTIVPPIQEGSGFVSSSRKSVSTGSVEATTPTAPNFAKETRESPGKIGPQIKLTTNYTSVGETGVRLPEGASAALAKPTKYHYYPHNQHIYLLPECAVQQVCNAVYVRLNYTQPLCACPGRYRDPCSASLDSDDLHTTELVTDPRTKALTLVKTCEPVAEMRECRTPRDWSLLALQNVRTGKSHYLVICRCPDANILEGPMSHDQPTYASVPGIRVYGMMCVQGTRRGRPLRYARSAGTETETEADDAESRIGRERSPGKEDSETKSPRFPWDQIQRLLDAAAWD